MNISNRILYINKPVPALYIQRQDILQVLGVFIQGILYDYTHSSLIQGLGKRINGNNPAGMNGILPAGG